MTTVATVYEGQRTRYLVTLDAGEQPRGEVVPQQGGQWYTCTCHHDRRRECAHISAVRAHLDGTLYANKRAPVYYMPAIVTRASEPDYWQAVADCLPDAGNYWRDIADCLPDA